MAVKGIWKAICKEDDNVAWYNRMIIFGCDSRWNVPETSLDHWKVVYTPKVRADVYMIPSPPSLCVVWSNWISWLFSVQSK